MMIGECDSDTPSKFSFSRKIQMARVVGAVHETLMRTPARYSQSACDHLSEESDELEVVDEPVEIVIEAPVVESGSYIYVCSECGSDLTEIPYYNRFYCENCGLHY